MKTIILMVLSLTLFHTAPDNIKVKETVATCYGNSPCSACSNCSHCKHCGAGGSCGVCSTKNVKKINTFSGSITTKIKTAHYVGRCKAITKKGSQCKRSGDGEGYCWQHGK
ncbi:hypothetical protein GJU39_15990 [Pedobacter petrophilus]|uniref:Uncharacterized protein n=1 Tax=Pedobacter petrophilus TaxID=1908241 RepID=A0A7K0G2S7_9SPHI|nr:hypothetical protein [Pedobacter petrophilus]MRX77589.1 hypothetical protein [Pedobacter petrophilus]